MKLDLSDPAILMLLSTWGVPYSYGAGEPKDAYSPGWPRGVKGIRKGIGWDCSGLAQVLAVKLGLLPSNAPDRTAAALFDLCQPISFDQSKLGDLCFYGPSITSVKHITMYLGDEVIIGANGGTSATNGDDQKAFVKLDRYNYRADFLGFRRLPNV